MKKPNLMPSFIVTFLLAGGLLAQAPAVTVVATPAPVINIASLSPTFRNLLSFVGDRLAVAGNERLTLSGTVTLANGSTSSVQVILELPDHVRYVQTTPARVVIYDGTTVQTSLGPAASADNNLVESLVLDGVERFLISQTEGRALRFFGPWIKVTDAHDSSRTTSFCELYQVSERERFLSGVTRKEKQFCFDSQTRLIASAFYKNPASGSQSINMETRWSGWSRSGKNQIPGIVARYENGNPVFVFVVSTSAVSAAVADGIFNNL